MKYHPKQTRNRWISSGIQVHTPTWWDNNCCCKWLCKAIKRCSKDYRNCLTMECIKHHLRTVSIKEYPKNPSTRFLGSGSIWNQRWPHGSGLLSWNFQKYWTLFKTCSSKLGNVQSHVKSYLYQWIGNCTEYTIMLMYNYVHYFGMHKYHTIRWSSTIRKALLHHDS